MVGSNNVSHVEGNSGTTGYDFVLTRTGDLSGTASVDFSVAGSGSHPANASDFAGGTLPSGTATFAAGSSTAHVIVNVSGDTTIEPNENFTVTLSNPSVNATIAAGADTGIGTIVNDDSNTISLGDPNVVGSNNVSHVEGNSGTTGYDFVLTRTGDLSGTASVDFSVAGSGANPANAADFGGTLPSGTATFAAGSSTAHVIVNVSGDTTIEPNENFTVTLSNPSVNATIAAGADTGLGTIVNDDSNTISLGDPNVVGSNNVSHVEGNSGTTGYDFVLTRTGDLSGTASVDFSVAGSGANPANAADFGGTLPSGTATFAAGSSTAHVIVNVSGDTLIEPNENFTVTLSNPSVNATIAAGADTGIGTIVNDDSNTISLGDPNVVGSNNVSHVEGNSGTTGYDFVLTRTGDLSGTASVDFSVAGSGSHPANAADFGGTLPSGTATFAAGSSTAHVIVNVSGDTTIEPNENFTVTLSNPSVNATIAAGADTGIGTIVNDDSNTISLGDPNVVGSNNVSHVEGNSGTTGYDFVLTRTGDLSGTASVDFSVAGSGSHPANAADFGGTLPSGTATFAAGSSTAHVIVNVSGDTTIEPNENFTVTLSNPSVNATIAAGADTGIGTIVNDDSNTISLGDPNVVGSNNVSHVEGNSGTTGYDFVLTRTGDLSGTASVDFSVAGSGSHPANAADFGGTLPSGTATFAAGSSTAHVIVNVSGDTLIEPNENFTVTLSNPSVNATIAAGADTGIGTIVNDDSNTISLGDPNVVGSNNVSHVEGNSGTTGYDFVLTRTGDLSGTASVDFSVAGSGSHPANAATSPAAPCRAAPRPSPPAPAPRTSSSTSAATR